MNEVGKINVPISKALLSSPVADRSARARPASVSLSSKGIAPSTPQVPPKFTNVDNRLSEVRGKAKANASEASANNDDDLKVAISNGPLDIVADIVAQYIPDASPNTRLSIQEDADTGQFIYRSVDRQSGDVVKQFPSEEILRYLKSSRSAKGLLLDDKA